MAAPDNANWINQAIDEVAAVLRSSTALMASGALAGGTGNVARVDTHELDRSVMDRHGVVLCAVRYLRHELSDGDTEGTTDYAVEVGVHLEASVPANSRPSERVKLWQRLQQAASTIPAIVATESKGARFADFATLARAQGGTAGDDADESSYYGFIQTGIRLEVRLID